MFVKIKFSNGNELVTDVRNILLCDRNEGHGDHSYIVTSPYRPAIPAIGYVDKEEYERLSAFMLSLTKDRII